MPVAGPLIVPDPRPVPPVLLLGAGALLLAGLVIRTLRRRRGRGSSRSAAGPSAIVLGSWRPASARGAGMLEIPLQTLRRVPEPVPVARTRFEEGTQKRGRAAKKRP